jgi:hypothetical protein
VVLISSLFAFGLASRADADTIEVGFSAVTVDVSLGVNDWTGNVSGTLGVFDNVTGSERLPLTDVTMTASGFDSASGFTNGLYTPIQIYGWIQFTSLSSGILESDPRVFLD